MLTPGNPPGTGFAAVAANGGIHLARQGSEGAVREWTALLERDPGNLSARWLLNLAYMTLGRHPDGVPARWLIPATVVPGEFEVGRLRMWLLVRARR